LGTALPPVTASIRGLGFAPPAQSTLRRHGIAATVVDGGVSGDTSEAGKARLGWAIDGLGESRIW
jgi:acyl-CoA thioesterase-1